jgi:hypothetical protein
MNHNYSGVNNLNGINLNIMNKFNKVNRQGYKTISINNNVQSNYIKSNNSKNIQQPNSVQEKKKKLSISKISNIKKEKKNYIPKNKPENIDAQLIINNNELYLENSHRRNNSLNGPIKKEYHYRQASSSQKKVYVNSQKNSKDINFIRKKLIIGNVPMIMNNNSISNKSIPISKEFLTTNENYNSKFIKRSNTNSNINENINTMNYYGDIFRYKNIIKILLFYIESLNKKIKYFFNKNQVEKNNKIKELSLQNKFLINENKNLKFKLIQFFYIMKTYVNNIDKIHESKYLKIIKGMVTENKFLRSINILPKNINNNYLSQLQKQIQIEKMKKELLMHKQFTKKEENIQNNKSNNSKDNKANNNLFNADESSLNKVSHKRQRTHFNLGKLSEENSISSTNKENTKSNNTNISSTSSENTAIENKSKEKDRGKESLILKHIKNKTQSQNVFSETLKDMSNSNKGLKKNNNNNNSKKNVMENQKENELNNKNINDNNNIKIDIKNNKIVNKISISNNIPENVNKIEYVNYSNNKKAENNKDVEIKKGDSLNMNENNLNKKQQSIYYRASREKEKKKLIFNK